MDSTPDTMPDRDQVTLFEPRADMRVSDQGALHDLLARPRKQFLRSFLPVILGVGGLLLPNHLFGIGIPAFVVVLGLVNLVTTLRASRLLSPGEFTALSDSLPRQVVLGDGDLLRAGRVVAMRLAEEGRWVVTRLPATDVPLLARLRRVWVFGPTPGGRIGLLVPGGSGPRIERLTDAPPAGAAPVPAPAPPAEWPPAPADDPALRLGLRARYLALWYWAAATACVIGLLTLDELVFPPTHSSVVLPVYGIFVAIGALQIPAIVGRYRRAAQATRWTWTRVAPGEIRILTPAWLTVRVRVDVPRDEINLEVAGPPALVLAVYDSRQLWLTGDLRFSGTMTAGIPEVPVVGRVRVTRRPAI